MIRKFLAYFRIAMILIYLALAGVILFTPVFDHIITGMKLKVFLALIIVLYAVFRIYSTWRMMKQQERDPSENDSRNPVSGMF